MNKSKSKNLLSPEGADLGYTQADLDEVSDFPELSDEELVNLRPVRDGALSEFIAPDLLAALRKGKGRGKQKTPTKIALSIRLSPDIIDHYKARGRGWQSLIEQDLRKAAKLKK